MRFVGVDLGWKTDPPRKDGTGYCQLDQDGRVEVAVTMTDDLEILGAIDRAGEAWVGIDASLRVTNESGLRSCEKRLRGLGIKVLPTSRSFLQRRFGGSRGEALVEGLVERGYSLARSKEREGRLIFEVFPHGTLHLLSAGDRPDYKKGGKEGRARGRQKVISLVNRWEPAVQVPAVLYDVGRTDKELEDILDAWVCVACVYSHWLNAGRTTQMVGDDVDGSILLGCQRHER